MTTLTLIGEPFPDHEVELQRAAITDLAQALTNAAPRACGTRLLVARGAEKPTFSNANATTERLPFRPALLPMMWQANSTARPLDGELVHSLTPMVPLRARTTDDGTQTSVSVTHSLAWEAPELLGSHHARLYRSFVRRALKYADVVVVPSYAVAAVLHKRYGSGLPIQVLPLATPTKLREPSDAAERRAHFKLPEKYLLTTAAPTGVGRLDWIFDAMQVNPGIGTLVVLEGCDPSSRAAGGKGRKGADGPEGAEGFERAEGVEGSGPEQSSEPFDTESTPDSGVGFGGSGGVAADATPTAVAVQDPGVAAGPESSAGASTAPHASAKPKSGARSGARSGSRSGSKPKSGEPSLLEQSIPSQLRDRVIVVQPREIEDMAATIAGAHVMLQPQQVADSGYLLHAALDAHVPIVHSECPATRELTLDAGVLAEDAASFATEIGKILADPALHASLALRASDRSRAFGWRAVAWQLWELHANM